MDPWLQQMYFVVYQVDYPYLVQILNTKYVYLKFKDVLHNLNVLMLHYSEEYYEGIFFSFYKQYLLCLF
jgi:hypothetical protein